MGTHRGRRRRARRRGVLRYAGPRRNSALASVVQDGAGAATFPPRRVYARSDRGWWYGQNELLGLGFGRGGPCDARR
jgi:hypothetical protein